MYCTKCGTHNPDGSTVCSSCGAYIESTPRAAAPAVNDPGKTLGLISMILGFVALGTELTGIAGALSLPSAIGALICGFIGKAQSAEAGESNTNAQTGIICGFVQIGLTVLSTILSLLAVVAVIVLYVAIYLLVFLGIVAIPVLGMGMYI